MKDHPVWGDGEVVFTAPKALQVKFTSSGNDLAIVFADWVMDLQGDSAPLSVTQAASIRVPIHITTKQTLVGHVQSLQIGLERTAGVRASIVAEFAGNSFSWESGFKTPVGAPPTESLPMEVWRTFSNTGLELGQGTGHPGPAPDYQVSIMVTLQRRTVADRAVLSIEGLDVNPALFK